MRKVIISSILLASIFLNASEASANSKHKSTKLNSVLGCGEWKPITGRDGAVIGEYRECRNIFGRERIEIVHFR